ncbi:FxsA family membrane protein [Streptomyces sp. NBC_00083]|uniref:FxsA family membrane protein n=1 Tax=Streptomyces sp. NBC_00083 TaxID=2975647 RepID=UPI00225A4B7A|nr:FxsA family membrane protein [Streptomyces sp. NBC_00083]MCX5383640.1 FxsA family protein [Streptomyces sp. NBC_00083]
MTTGTPPPTVPKRSRARTLVPLGIAAWLVLEIWLLTVVAGASSGLLVLLLLIGGLLLGGYVIKRAGRRAFRNLTETVRQQQSGGAEPASAGTSGGGEGNALIMLAGLLLIIPGFVSDALGLLLLVAPVRKSVSRLFERSLDKRMRAAVPGGFGDAFQQARIHYPDGKVVQGEVVRDDAAAYPPRDDLGPRPPLTP